MPNEILKETLTKYVDAKLYDINVLYEAIASRATVSLDVLRSCVNDVHVPYLKRTYGIRENPYYKVTGYFDEEDEMDMETFIRRVPFIFYIYSNKEKGLYADFNSLHSSFMNYSNCGKLDTLFTMLEKLFYTYELSLETIFSYVLRQFGTFENFEDFEKWFNYVELTHKNGGADYEPKNLLHAYNKLLVDSGAAPFRYTIKSYRRVDREIIVNGNLPYDFDKNSCDFTWILLWINNAKEVYVEPTGDAELNVDIHIVLNPETEVYQYLEDHWDQVYVGPAIMYFDLEAIAQRRKDLKYSQEDVATIIGVSRRSYQYFEKGEYTPNALQLIRLMNLLNFNDVEALTSKDDIADPKLEKFLSNKPISEFLPARF